MNQQNIHFAATRPDINQAAFWYWQAGLSVIPCRGKIPNIGTWHEFQQRRATRTELDNWIKAGKFETIGIICGAVSDNLAVLDLDSQAAVDAFDLKFPNLAGTYTVTSGSGKGKHVYFQCQRLPPTTRVHLGDKYGFELRTDGCYVIAPPSIHPDSRQPYKPANDAAVKLYPDLEFLRQWIHGMIVRKYVESGQQPPKPLPPVHRPGTWTQRDEYMKTAYLRSAMNQQVDRLINAPVGARNDQLYMSAKTLGELVAGGELSRSQIESLLTNAAVTVGLEAPEIERTIASGLNAGANNPRKVPPTPPKKA